MIRKLSWLCLLGCATFSTSAVVDDVYSQLSSGFLPSPVKYFNKPGDLDAQESSPESVLTVNTSHDNSLTSSDPQPRFGYPLYTGSSMHGTNPGVYSPVKLDLGGLLLGTVIGLGAVLLLPKILHVISSTGHSSYGHYARNDEGITNKLMDVWTRVDDALAAQHINTSVCLQRALCSTVQSSTEDSSTLASLLSTATKNPLVSFLLEGSRLEKAVEIGSSGLSCSAAFPQCSFNQDSVTDGLKAITSSLQT